MNGGVLRKSEVLETQIPTEGLCTVWDTGWYIRSVSTRPVKEDHQPINKSSVRTSPLFGSQEI